MSQELSLRSDLFTRSAQASQESSYTFLFTVTQIRVQTAQTLKCCFTIPLFRNLRHKIQSIVLFGKLFIFCDTGHNLYLFFFFFFRTDLVHEVFLSWSSGKFLKPDLESIGDPLHAKRESVF